MPIKRIKYFSYKSQFVKHKDVTKIFETAEANNKSRNLTGFLIHTGKFFVQILEGEEKVVDDLYFNKLLKDNRHYDVRLLSSERNCKEQLFPNWSMKSFHFSETDYFVNFVLDSLLESVTNIEDVLFSYTQPRIKALIEKGIAPEKISPYKANRIVLMADILGYTTICQKVPPKDLLKFVNKFLSIVSNSVHRYDGEVTKFVGDCVVAVFEESLIDEAIQASLNILKELEVLRQWHNDHNVFGILYCGIGMDFGQVIEGNIGTNIKRDFTVLGTTVNTAARIESLTRDMGRYLLLSENMVKRSTKRFEFKSLGEVHLKGKKNPEKIYAIENLEHLDEKMVYDRIATYAEKSMAKSS